MLKIIQEVKQDLRVLNFLLLELISQLKTQRRVGKVVFESHIAAVEKAEGSARAKHSILQQHNKELLKRGYIPDEKYSFLKTFLKQSISQKASSYVSVDKNESVLPSPLTRLVNLFVDETLKNILTIDSDALVRIWSLESGECVGSYPIEQRTDEFSEKKKLTACSVDSDFKHIVVSFEGGGVQVNNLHSGSLVFNEAEHAMILDSEVSDFRFFPESCSFWFVAACWEGRVTFFTESQMSKGRAFVKFIQAKGSH